MAGSDFTTTIVDRIGGGKFWNVWNAKYERTDSGDMGIVELRENGYVALSRGDTPRQVGIFQTLDGAVSALISAY